MASRSLLLLLIGPAFLLMPLHVASADDNGSVITSRPPITFLGLPTQRSDATGTDGYGDRIGALAIEPLRLALFGAFPPQPLNEPGCRERSEAAGSLTGGSTLFSQRTIARNLLGGSSPMAPRLTLFGFSRGGCLLDGAIGGGLTFTVPIKPDIFFVLGGGAIYLPNAGPNGAAAYDAKARADLVFARPGGRSFNIGVSTIRNSPSVSVGGVF